MKHTQPLRGVNLGGWLVLERWMTPSVFAGTNARNEFELSKTEQGRQRIRRHHREFIQEQDLRWLKRQGIELLRVPVGYWIFGDDDRYVSSIDQLDWLVRTSLTHGFKLLLDLHAAPGAQNRAEHSGSGNTISDKHSIKWLNDTVAQQQAIEVLIQIARRYQDFPHVWGLQLLNEPAVDLFGLKLARFYRRAYRALRGVARPGTKIVFSDGYAPIRLTNCLGLMAKPDLPAVMDCHIYQTFGSAAKQRRFERDISRLTWTRRLLTLLRVPQPIIIGEWSVMLPNATSPEQTARYAEAQQQAFSPAIAHVFWNYKTEAHGRWNYRDQVEKELIQYV